MHAKYAVFWIKSVNYCAATYHRLRDICTDCTCFGNNQLFRDAIRDLDHAPFQKYRTSIFWQRPRESCVPNLKSLALTVLEICSRVCQIFSRSRDLGHALFRNIVHPSCGRAKWKLCFKFEVSSFSGFGDMVEGMPNFLGVTWPRPRPLSEISYFHLLAEAKGKLCTEFEISSFNGFGDARGYAKYSRGHVT